MRIVPNSGGMATKMPLTQPRFKDGDRCFSHYTMKWGTVVKLKERVDVRLRGVATGDIDHWYDVRWDDDSTDLMNDGGSQGWEMARIIPPAVAERFGYGKDPDTQPHG